MADWSLIQQPNFAQAALAGYQAGNAIGRQRRLDAALGGVDLERPETIMPVLQADPSTGAALLGSSMKMAQYKHELAGKAALSDYLLAQKELGDTDTSASAAPSVPAATPATADPNAPVASGTPDAGSNDIVVTGQSPLEQARVALIKADPDTYIKTETAIAGMNEAQRKALDAANDTFGASIEAARNMPYEQRKPYIQSIRPQLITHGVPAQMIDSFDPTDTNITGIENQVLGVKGILEKQDKDRTFSLDQARFGETQRHDRADEANAAANVGIAAGHLALDRQTEARVAKQQAGGGAGGGIPSPATQADYAALPAGTRYRAPDGSIRIKH